MLSIHKLTKTLGGRTLLREAEMTINWGERVALVGPNGAGKSTLFRMILGEDDPDEGTIERDEYAITGYLAQEAGDPGDETILEIAMGINPEMVNVLRTMREHEARDPDWMKKLIARHMAEIRWFWRLFPGLLGFRWRRLLQLPVRQRITHLPAACARFVITLVASWQSARFLRRGIEFYWPKTSRQAIAGTPALPVEDGDRIADSP